MYSQQIAHWSYSRWTGITENNSRYLAGITSITEITKNNNRYLALITDITENNNRYLAGITNITENQCVRYAPFFKTEYSVEKKNTGNTGKPVHRYSLIHIEYYWWQVSFHGVHGKYFMFSLGRAFFLTEKAYGMDFYEEPI